MSYKWVLFSYQLFQGRATWDPWDLHSSSKNGFCQQGIDFIYYFYFFCLLFLLYFTLQYCMVLPYIDMNPHGCTCVPKHEPPSHLLPHNISLGQALILNMGKGIPLVCHTEGILPMLTCVVSQPFPHFVANKSLKEEQGGVFLEDAHPVLGTHLDLLGIQRM